MTIIGRASVEPFLRKNATARGSTARWFEVTERAEWHSIMEVRKSFRSADAIRGTDLTCFNVGGNKYRLLAIVAYARQTVSIVALMTHADYSKKYA